MTLILTVGFMLWLTWKFLSTSYRHVRTLVTHGVDYEYSKTFMTF